jgi:hypothetical protein
MATLDGSASPGNERPLDPWVEYWRDFVLKTKNGLTWTATTPEDIPELMKCVRFLERYCGPQGVPSLFQWPVILSLVARDEQGEIVDGCYIEMIAEIAKLGFTKEGVEDFLDLKPSLVGFMRAKKIRVAQVHARKRIAGFLAPIYDRIGFKAMERFSFFQGRI